MTLMPCFKFKFNKIPISHLFFLLSTKVLENVFRVILCHTNSLVNVSLFYAKICNTVYKCGLSNDYLPLLVHVFIEFTLKPI